MTRTRSARPRRPYRRGVNLAERVVVGIVRLSAADAFAVKSLAAAMGQPVAALLECGVTAFIRTPSRAPSMREAPPA